MNSYLDLQISYLENHKKEGWGVNFDGVSGMMEPECADVVEAFGDPPHSDTPQ